MEVSTRRGFTAINKNPVMYFTIGLMKGKMESV